MTTILRFEEDGVAYAKGFVNQEGLSIYVLPGYHGTLKGALKGISKNTSLLAFRSLSIETSSSFPGDPYPPGTVAQ